MEKRKKVAFLTKRSPSRRIQKELPVLKHTEKETRHYWMATSIMALLRWELLDKRIKFHENDCEPYSLVVDFPEEEYSCFCSGFNKYIDVQRLIPWGKPDPNFEERRFATAEAVVKFLKNECEVE
jgi:hypothetical protein